jgi:3-oxoacyl-[acyl-carrier protein] reductase
MPELTGRTALITGGGGDIGLAIATALADGLSHIVLADRDPARLEEASARLAGRTGISVHALTVDVRSREAVRQAIGWIQDVVGGLDILVNTAGCPARYRLVVDTDDAEWDEIVESHFRGTATACAAAIPLLARSDGGRIVNTVSVAAFNGAPGRSVYAAAKAAIVAFTRSLSAEVGGQGITANCVAPGFTASRRVAGNFDEAGRQAHLRELGVVLEPLRMATTSEIGLAVRYLCSPEAGYITGTVLHLNGGAYRP